MYDFSDLYDTVELFGPMMGGPHVEEKYAELNRKFLTVGSKRRVCCVHACVRASECECVCVFWIIVFLCAREWSGVECWESAAAFSLVFCCQ